MRNDYKTRFFVILNTVKHLNLMKIQDFSLLRMTFPVNFK
jgi:hypothetical protein